MAEDDARDDADDADDAGLADTLGGFGAQPLLEGSPDPEGAGEELHPEWHPDDDGGEVGETGMGRLVGWLRWAAAPLGFFLFLSALTAYGVLRDRDGSDAADSPAPVATTAAPVPTTAAPAVTTVPTTVPPVPTTATAPAPPPTAAPPPVESEARPSPAPPVTSAIRFGPVCGYKPGELVRITINGFPAPPVTAEDDGCVRVRR